VFDGDNRPPIAEEDVFLPGEAADIPRPKPARSGMLREIVEVIVLFAVIYTLVNLVSARFIVDGSSMAPNFATGQYVFVDRVSYLISAPQRGDVVVLRSPESSERDLIKRIIGLPGERITIRNELVYVNDTPLPEDYLYAPPHYQGDWQLAENEYFVLGDNRNNSRDSHNFGPVSRDNLIGRARAIYWPLRDLRVISGASYESATAGAPALVLTATASAAE
jgi:signal peptidase I